MPGTKDLGSEDLSGKMFAPAEWDGGFLGQWYEDLKAEALLAEAFEENDDAIKESGMAADRAQTRATLLDADLSEVWLRAKVQQLLDSCDEIEAERDALREWIIAVKRAAEVSPISQSALIEGAAKVLPEVCR